MQEPEETLWLQGSSRCVSRYFYTCVCVQKSEALDPPELGLLAVLRHLTWMLGT
ncbi:rCG56867, isoform CRA_a [Rattus norvegicus]|uniref:RCG56867, isoform CRA_a n=1 Tax=Rattus norvegicus TaxID=10116 RepID=A6KNT8_RAT|nr:rCG56867, isoform CRA_a [Rattus norvegicus]EDL87982.1 rCG56867, isoform CRA_a [Rattus norvegicus]